MGGAEGRPPGGEGRGGRDREKPAGGLSECCCGPGCK